jgi:purine-binding chemotaxis protein CheW
VSDDDGSTDGDGAADVEESVAAALEGVDPPADTTTLDEGVDPFSRRTDDPAVAGVESATTDADTEATEEETVTVLEFVLAGDRYCLDIEYVEQIVERGSVTRVPNAPAVVEGVVDLRGDVTTVVDPTRRLATDASANGDRIVVFDPDRMAEGWTVGWVVDGVRRVTTVSPSSVRESPVDEPWIEGVLKREADDELVVWTDPGELMRADADEAGQ